MAAELGETVLGVDVVRDHYLVFVALLHKQRQAEREQRNVKKSTRLTILGKEHAVIVNLPSRVVKSVFCMWPECESCVQPHSFITPPVDTHSSLRRRQRLVSHSFCEKKTGGHALLSTKSETQKQHCALNYFSRYRNINEYVSLTEKQRWI